MSRGTGSEPSDEASKGNASDARRFPVVGIGASAGGLESITELLSHLPPSSGAAFVLITHMEANHRSELVQILSPFTSMRVLEATDGALLEVDHVYVIPAGFELSIQEGRFRLWPRNLKSKIPFLPVDRFFRSLALEKGEAAIGVILSGTGSDGMLGVSEIKSAAGFNFAQDEKSAKFPEMPLNARRSRAVDAVLNPRQIAEELASIALHGYFRTKYSDAASQDALPLKGSVYGRIMEILRVGTGVDFSDYRDNTIRRRIERRMALSHVQTLEEYSVILENSGDEIAALYRDILINVTRFFRDSEMFDALKSTVFPEIVRGKTQDNPLRIWVPGCSTGQEVYSIAISLLEYLEGAHVSPAIQIFGTDLSDSTAVERARVGLFPETISGEVSPDRLARFFTKDDQGYRIARRIREICIFAKQNVAVDPPFSQVDLISCRNLLIYLSSALQKRVIPAFHYSLKAGGFLVLGASESIGRFTDLFQLVDSKNRIYCKNSILVRTYPHFTNMNPSIPALEVAAIREKTPSFSDLQKEADRILIHRYAPAGVLVSDELEVLQFRGKTGSFLEPASGEASFNLLRMARENLFSPLRFALEEARKLGRSVRKKGIRHREGSQMREVCIEVIPVRLSESSRGGFLVLFEPLRSGIEDKGLDASEEEVATFTVVERDEVEILRRDLEHTKEYLQSIIEQKAASNEELRCANEEAISANEELQSANEELQTSKEELQSTNEELTTVNEELQNRNLELVRINDDLMNLISSVKIPIVIFGTDLRVRRFTPAATSLLGFTPLDIGRFISSMRLPLDIQEIEGFISEVIANVTICEREVKDLQGQWYLLRIHPYRTADNRIDGAVAVFMDITERRMAEMLNHAQLAEISAANAAKDRFLAALSHELRTPLTPVLLAASALESREDLPEDIRQEVGMIRRNVGLEAQLIDDLLDVTRVAQGKLSVNFASTRVLPLLERSIRVVEDAAKSKGVQLELVTTPIDLECIVTVDPVRLQQVFWNLMSNAIKFTLAGGRVVIRFSFEIQGVVRIEFLDTGIGIHPDILPKIFNAFEQGSEKITQKYGGLGLGLAISKAILELHGGAIYADSLGVGKGARFIVELPSMASEATPEVIQEAVSREICQLRLLVIEDHVDTAKVLRNLLLKANYEVSIVHTVEAAKMVAMEKRFDLVISDLGLPDGHGLELMQHLKKMHHLPGIALTGYGTEIDRRQILAAGFSEFLVKPIDFLELQAALSRMSPEALRNRADRMG